MAQDAAFSARMTRVRIPPLLLCTDRVAQLVEHYVDIVGVAGSIPAGIIADEGKSLSGLHKPAMPGAVPGFAICGVERSGSSLAS